MRWSDNKPLAFGAYGLAALLALFELGALWQTLHPDVPPDYRAYYIDRTTTCLPQPVSGEYTLGTEIDFRSGGPNTRALRPCGWEGPAGDGMHAVGEESRLRFTTGPAQNLTLMLEITGVTLPGPPEQHVIVRVNDTEIGELVIAAGATDRFTLAVPASVIGDKGLADIALLYPDAIRPGTGDANTRKRSIKLVAAALSPAQM